MTQAEHVTEGKVTIRAAVCRLMRFTCQVGLTNYHMYEDCELKEVNCLYKELKLLKLPIIR